MKIEIISGSPRQNSVTRRVALHLKDWFVANTDHEIGLIEVKDLGLPLIQSVFISVDRTPDEFKWLSQRMFDADAFILVSPEYNGSYSPAMKNLLDHYPKQHRKPFGLVTASPGPMGGIRAAQQLLLLVAGLFGIASPYLLLVPGVEKKLDESGNLLEPYFQNNIHNFVSEFLWMVEGLSRTSIENVLV